MRDALRVSKAPVIFSHSSARGARRSSAQRVGRGAQAGRGERRRGDGQLRAGLCVGSAAPLGRRPQCREGARYNAPPYGGLYIGQPDRAEGGAGGMGARASAPRRDAGQVADHIEHIVKVAGIDHVGLGGDFDGVGGDLPEGLDGVDTYPALLAELMRRGWSDADDRQARRRQRAARDGSGRARRGEHGERAARDRDDGDARRQMSFTDADRRRRTTSRRSPR